MSLLNQVNLMPDINLVSPSTWSSLFWQNQLWPGRTSALAGGLSTPLLDA